jgi:hypothetical protein
VPLSPAAVDRCMYEALGVRPVRRGNGYCYPVAPRALDSDVDTE